MTVDKSETRIRKMFAAISGRYDLLNHLLSMNVDRYWRWRTTRVVPIDGSMPVLDLATGTGDLAFAYLRQSRGQIPIVGADFCREMLAIGQRKAQRADPGGRTRFVEADAQRLPFPDDSFQIVSIAFGLRNVTDTQRGLAEMVRVVQPGGRVAILEFSMPRNRVLAAIYRFYFRRVLPLIGQALARNRDEAYRYLPASVLEFPDGPALLDVMSLCGLAQNRWIPLTFGIASLYIGVKPAGPVS